MPVAALSYCKKCDGVLVENYGEISCILCSTPHDENGEIIKTRDPIAEGTNLTNIPHIYYKRRAK